MFCGCDGIGRHARFRFLCASVWVRVPSSALLLPEKWASEMVQMWYSPCCYRICIFLPKHPVPSIRLDLLTEFFRSLIVIRRSRIGMTRCVLNHIVRQV